jgi:hypothetical protein
VGDLNKMNIDIRDEKILYVSIGEWVYYIDDSTNEQVIKKWKTGIDSSRWGDVAKGNGQVRTMIECDVCKKHFDEYDVRNSDIFPNDNNICRVCIE